MSPVRRFGFAWGCFTLSLASAAWGQDSAAAQALFERGVEDLDAGRLERACPALAESHRLDPVAGTLFALSECEAKAGKFASAFGHYQDYLGLVSRLSAEQRERHAERVASAREQTEALRPRVPTLTLLLPASAPRGLVVERNGVVLKAPALGVALPIDPGDHVIVTRDTDGNEARMTVTLEPGQAVQLEVRVPTPSVKAPVVAGPAAPPPPARVANPPPVDAKPSRTLRTWGWIAGGVGITGVAVGSIAGAVALGKKATVSEHCRGELCDPEGKRAADAGQTAAAVSTVAFGAGVVGLGTSLVLLLTSSDTPSAGATVRPRFEVAVDRAFAGFEGAF